MNVQKGTASLSRINLIDVIRGIAIIGILLINIHFFEPSDIKSIKINTFDSKMVNYIELFSLNKFHFIFAFLFGVSTSIFINNLQKKQLTIWVHIRRMILLFIAGALSSFLWDGDILKIYAVMGIVLLLFQKLSNIIKLNSGILLIVFGNLLPILIKLMEIRGIHIPHLVNSFILLMVMLSTLGHMLLGQALYHLGIFTNRDLLPKLKIYWLVFLLITIILWTISLFIQNQGMLHTFNQNSGPIVGMFYILSIVLMYQFRSFQKLLSLFIPYGKMAFTNYLGQTIIGVVILTPIFSSYTVHVYGMLLLYTFVIVFQIIFSFIWMHYFLFGPLEWLWRCGTYLKIQPIKRSKK
ncbi:MULTISPECIES: DUF418 domain-containing protein [Staphylococcus]|uniref:DUF418 domain-containing protein n=1 Tax=Staphylococcus TaxID=1279 RepID=UPI0008533BB2|nr:DUF418 domain-containing protein [Staphylococcus shinii]MDW8563791.1 DUF418 domain-containing protein [Staphylococcus shinii]MDW8567031.1 DUF418 domain-containing protein [Staphylococcus shinii]MEC5301813.1 DUF418 domain-containing protein [Staphylococcus shinii]OEK89167.1 hypothetical protein AST15_05095 [Staphylococcus shinii]